MVLIRSREFLGCLALGTGIWILALLSLMLGVTGSVIGWLEIVLLNTHTLPLEDKVFLFIRTIVLSLLVLLSLIGRHIRVNGFVSIFVGLSKRPGLAFIYSKMVASHYILLLLALASTLVLTLRSVNDTIVNQCTDGTSNRMIIEFCSPGWSLVQGALICIVGASVFVQLYAFVVAGNFAYRLDLETALVFPDSSSFRSDKFHPLEDKPSFLV
ncbi:hypothetical protein J3R30DRAFT_3400461 [Lentinula aciculospora]|uniref:Uncharacterized protein n=1 Tax=Lentinula aciculospora TaxID=153920 RepID=A0A9W9APR5_9AGAR|nr:hypothetical protein J3R30DRAFT_3400461 [Lentinula aciculospora]